MEIAQTVGNAISSDWTLAQSFTAIGGLLVIICSLTGFIFVNAIRAVEKKFDSTTQRFTTEIERIHKRVDKSNEVMMQINKSHLETRDRVLKLEHEKTEAEDLAEIIITKLRAAGGL